MRAANLQTDPVLLPFLRADGEEEAEACLDDLIREHADPVVRNIVGYKFRVFFSDNKTAAVDEAEDVRSDTLVRLLGRLTELRINPELQSIQDFRSYVAVTTYRTCHEHLRRKYPRRFSLKNKIRYFLRHKEGFALWETDAGEWLAGKKEWQGSCDEGAKVELSENLEELDKKVRAGRSINDQSLNDLLATVFDFIKSPVELDQLVGVIAQVISLQESNTESVTHDAGVTEAGSSSVTPGYDKLADQQSLRHIWNEVVKMSPRHCAALLLNLKDSKNDNALELFVFTGAASFAEIAAAISQPEEWLAEIWNELPIEDSRIAERLGMMRQQVINLRKTARSQLAKSLRQR